MKKLEQFLKILSGCLIVLFFSQKLLDVDSNDWFNLWLAVLISITVMFINSSDEP
ncbi:hypothetical protein [Paraferrimonas sp. SM1919]|uniref:hypothetical protein n=1 Tax=Paraferrimonas sp. SM1919 TaxID=2662263 RepID=UPI0013D8549A|nr:hypothetical protein [Paraferrimonas sp. SM1919]